MADRAVGVEEPFAEFVECGPPIKDQVVAQFHLRKEQAVLATRLIALCVREEWCEAGQPFTAAA